jgi:antitoxin ParD1/3/4
MARSSTLNVSLTETLERYVRAKVASGKYESASEVIRESLRLSQAAEQSQRLFWAGVRTQLAEARRQVADGSTVDGETVMNEIISSLGHSRSTGKRKKPSR